SVTEFGQLLGRGSEGDDERAIFAAARAQLERLLPFHALGFWTAADGGSEFALADCGPDDAGPRLRAAVAAAIASGAFVWAVAHNRVVRTRDGETLDTLVLHALHSGARVVGMVSGLLREDTHDVTPPVWDLLSLIL